MSSDTPGTRPDPELVAEGDTDQLSAEDTLVDRGVDDLLDEGWAPPERRPRHRLTTVVDEIAGDTIDERLDQEEPEVWQTDVAGGPGRWEDRAGRLSPARHAYDGESTASLEATDAGIAGGGAGAEEAAMHEVDEP
ncbi:DUF5709 domain-containing protein [Actinotalea sp. M2MS4P-6]|uniref:DUF5709 domain-containing protein n=1 Tax=Actinotalea sp. M2MS4P-6 TaxID=2983762 RepID=UPI0021E46FA0|nr:DUF5709 domain-containing protein [Actinotalea sp. M2MS4P-6]MCV2395535.1 DUF5709 domain-containing protein [Actinotalea sp. M2MS4P-6]